MNTFERNRQAEISGCDAGDSLSVLQCLSRNPLNRGCDWPRAPSGPGCAKRAAWLMPRGATEAWVMEPLPSCRGGGSAQGFGAASRMPRCPPSGSSMEGAPPCPVPQRLGMLAGIGPRILARNCVRVASQPPVDARRPRGTPLRAMLWCGDLRLRELPAELKHITWQRKRQQSRWLE